MAIFAENALLDKACRAIAALEPCPFAGKVTADQVKIALGELLDIWPESIAPKYMRHGQGTVINFSAVASLSRPNHGTVP